MPGQLSLDISGDANGIVVRAIGPLDAENIPLLDGALTQLSMEPVNVRLNLRGVSSIDQTGLETLLRLSTRCRANGGALTLESPTPVVLALMQSHRTQEELEVRDR